MDPSTGSVLKMQRSHANSSDHTRLLPRQGAGRPEGGRLGAGALQEEHEIELLEYEWPDLPPIPSIKDAITRSRVSYGISYLLPVDKGRNSINNCFRTDLRAMFQEPYASDDLQYDDNRVKLSAKVHFLSNTGDTKWTRQHLSSIPVHLNARSEQTRRLYSHSAPSAGTASRRMGIDPHKLRKRSNLFLPIKAAVPPELIRLRKEVEAIVKSVCEDDEDFDEEQLKQTQMTLEESGAYPAAEMSVEHARDVASRRDSVACTTKKELSAPAYRGAAELAAKLQSIHVTPERFQSYEDFKKCKPPKATIPECVKSEYLTDDQNQQIWEWLHYGEEINEFEFFLSVCG